MKKFLTGILLSASIALLGCWVEVPVQQFYLFNEIYIHSVNNKHLHYIGDNLFAHNYQVDLPITVQIQAKKLEDAKIRSAVLQYKIERDGKTIKKFTTVKTLTTIKYGGSNEIEKKVNQYGKDLINWKLDFKKPVNLFGRNGIIDIPKSKIQKGDVIIIRIYLDNGMYENGAISLDINSSLIDSLLEKGTNYERYYRFSWIYSNYKSWSPPHYFKVIYSGKRRPII